MERNIHVLSELDTMMATEHQNVIQLFQGIETIENIYIVMEYAGGGQRQHPIPEPSGMQKERGDLETVGADCVMCYGHKKGITNLDLKAGSSW